MRIIYDVDSSSVCILSANVWVHATGRNTESFKAELVFGFPKMCGTEEIVELHGDSRELTRLFETALKMLNHETERRFPIKSE